MMTLLPLQCIMLIYRYYIFFYFFFRGGGTTDTTMTVHYHNINAYYNTTHIIIACTRDGAGVCGGCGGGCVGGGCFGGTSYIIV